MSVVAIVPAAGAGARFGGDIAKPFAPLLGKPLLAHTLSALEQAPEVRWIIVVAKKESLQEMSSLIREAGITKALSPCAGGASRAESVALGFAALPDTAEWVLVHDAARPCLTGALIAQTVTLAREHGAVACGMPASVTVKAADEEARVRLTLDREHLWLVQTPQVFRRDWFAQALERAKDRLSEFPDDVSVLEWAGFAVRMVPGDPLNLKVTTQEDSVLAEAVLRLRALPGISEHAHRNRLRRSPLRTAKTA